MAIDMNHRELANKSESYEICFVPDNDYRSFLKHRVPELEQQVKGGEFVLRDGTVVGKHKGYPFYTVGQRKGLEIAMGEPMYVLEIQAESNRVVLGKAHELERAETRVRNLNLIKYASIDQPMEALTKIRYKDSGAMSSIVQEGGEMKINFHHHVSAIAPGQSAVFYEGNDLLGGGFLI